MKRLYFFLIITALFFNTSFAQEYEGIEASRIVPGAKNLLMHTSTSVPLFIKFENNKTITFNEFRGWLNERFHLQAGIDLQLYSTETDQLGYIHYKYRVTFMGYPLEKCTWIVHTMNGKVVSMNGFLPDKLSVNLNQKVAENYALQVVLDKVQATRYKWQIPGEEELLKSETNNPNATYYPKGTLVLMTPDKSYKSANLVLCYKFDVYADEPVSRAYYFVDVNTGEIIAKEDILLNKDVTGTAYTKYSGQQSITTDSFQNSRYRLRELKRGTGVETYNLQKSTSYSSAVDFVDSNNIWNNINPNHDEAATDAHWGAEMTYDYYKNTFNRNSLDNNGMKIKSYVHYGNNYNNAFWDGQRMTYGDGTSGKPFTVTDIIAHEMTHGVVTHTAGLGGNDGAALNESFADIFGTMAEFYAKPSLANWQMGDNIIPIRLMSNPKMMGDPDTYYGLYWDSITFESHRNSTVQSYWFYLLCQGGTGTNDKGKSYNVTGIGKDKASNIAFRNLSVYLNQTSDYYDSRYYSIMAASDLYGECSAEVESTIKAWYAVGIGEQTRKVDFATTITTNCAPPFTVKFNNKSDAFSSYLWEFGDGKTSGSLNPSNTYTTYGSFTVKLKGLTICGVKDSIIKNDFIVIDSAFSCYYLMPGNSTQAYNSNCTGTLLDNGGQDDYTGNLNSTFTITPPKATSILLTFKSFAFESCGATDCDYLSIYKGKTAISGNLIGKYTGFNLPNGGTILVNDTAVTIVQHSDPLQVYSGFEMDWQCITPTMPPVSLFDVSPAISCDGNIKFIDKTVNNPVSWTWQFGDGDTSVLQNPTHIYRNSGIYDVRLKTTNANGSNSLIKYKSVRVNFPLTTPFCDSVSSCTPKSFKLDATGIGIISWYSNPNDTIPLDTGFSYTTPVLSKTTSYYIQSTSIPSSQHIGPLDSTIYSGGYYNNSTNHYMIFDAYSPFNILSVKVYAGSTASRTIYLADSSGKVLQSKVISIPKGSGRINLDFKVPVSTKLRLGAVSPTNLYRNQGGISYPITIPGLISIIETSAAAGGSTGYFYYFYDWDIIENSCKSERVEVIAYIDSMPGANFTYTKSNLQVTFINKCTSGKDYLWDFGDGNTTYLKNPVHTYTTTGNYKVKLTTSNSCGSDTITQYIQVTTGVNELKSIKYFSIYPNPANDRICIDLQSVEKQEMKVVITSALGKQMYDNVINSSNPFNDCIKVTDYPKGLYFVKLETGQGSVIRKVVIE